MPADSFDIIDATIADIHAAYRAGTLTARDSTGGVATTTTRSGGSDAVRGRRSGRKAVSHVDCHRSPKRGRAVTSLF